MRSSPYVFLIGNTAFKSLSVKRQQNSYRTRVMHGKNIGQLESIVIPIECHDCSRVQILSTGVRRKHSGENVENKYFASNELRCKSCGSQLMVETTITVSTRELGCTVMTENCHMVPIFGLSQILHELAELRRTK